METINVVNIKCGGCEGKITSALEKAGLNNISINIPEQKVSFDGDREIAKGVLSRLGYPEASSPQAKSLYKKSKSYLSCAIGRLK
jgi:copper chaperone CopZ